MLITLNLSITLMLCNHIHTDLVYTPKMTHFEPKTLNHWTKTTDLEPNKWNVLPAPTVSSSIWGEVWWVQLDHIQRNSDQCCESLWMWWLLTQHHTQTHYTYRPHCHYETDCLLGITNTYSGGVGPAKCLHPWNDNTEKTLLDRVSKQMEQLQKHGNHSQTSRTLLQAWGYLLSRHNQLVDY